MIKFVVSFVMFVFLTGPAFAQLPCGVITESPSQVTFTLNESDSPESITSVQLYRGSSEASLAYSYSVDLPAANPDGSYTVTLGSSGHANNVSYFVAVAVSNAFGNSPVSNSIEVPATISGPCPGPNAPNLISVVVTH